MNLGNREGVYILPNKGQIMKIANDEKRGTYNLKGNSWWGKAELWVLPVKLYHWNVVCEGIRTQAWWPRRGPSSPSASPPSQSSRKPWNFDKNSFTWKKYRLTFDYDYPKIKEFN